MKILLNRNFICFKKFSSLPYAHAKIGPFAQEEPCLRNPFTDDPLIERTLRRWMPNEVYSYVSKDLERFGDKIVKEIDNLGRECELNPPKLESFDAWGKRIDNLVTCQSWKRLKQIAAEEGLISIAFDRKMDPTWRRVYQMAKLYMFSPSSGLVSCPLSMTDGAAKTIKELNLDKKFPELEQTYQRLISTNPQEAWTSGQWMTEKRGGSDVGRGTDTKAVHIEGNKYKLYGYKWFSSAIDADIAFTLARDCDKHGNDIEGSKGLSLFYLQLRNPETKKLNGIQIVKLKNKLGTRQLPTAELLLDGVEALKVSENGRGVASMAIMLNTTRIHMGVSATAAMRRVISLARDYATKRTVFGQKQADWPLHLTTLAKLEVETRGCFLLLMEAARLLGRQESGQASNIELLNLRLITPILKSYTAKQSIPLISEGIECFGGQGYIEDTGLSILLRDAQVNTIWEGTTNVLGLDVLRVFNKNITMFQALKEHVQYILNQNKKQFSNDLKECEKRISQALETLGILLNKVENDPHNKNMNLERCAREISFAIARIYIGALLTSHAADPISTQSDKDCAYRFCVEDNLYELDEEIFLSIRNDTDRNIIYENFQ
uniref:Uncharacterized protein n=1 Tax=Acrobeloides nanus TaxID=290746 RepID=A0A914E866_9BILA